MSVTPKTTVNQVLIQINVTFDDKGLAVYTPLFFENGLPTPDTVTVNTGDRVGWFVQAQVRAAYRTFPYQITFANPAMFGTSSIAVPHGGGSGYLTVVSIRAGERCKYTISIANVYPPFDPEIQVNPDGLDDKTLATPVNPAHWIVLWDVGAHTVTFQKNDGLVEQLNVALGDIVQFWARDEPAPHFDVEFPPQLNRKHIEQSPFDASNTTFDGNNPIDPQTTATDELPVLKVIKDMAIPFVFIFTLLPDGTTQSPQVSMTVSAPPKEHKRSR